MKTKHTVRMAKNIGISGEKKKSPIKMPYTTHSLTFLVVRRNA